MRPHRLAALVVTLPLSLSCGALVSARGDLVEDRPDAGSIDGTVRPDAGRVDDDGGARDAGLEDVAAPPEGGPDAGVDGGTDGGLLDAGPLDAGTLDGGTLDGGTLDGGTLDAGAPDAGVIGDGGDAGVVDAGNDGWPVPGATHRARLVVPAARTVVFGGPSASPLTDFPLLVRLPPERLPPVASVDGADLRFYLEDGTLLAHEVERWDPTGTSLVWVKVPELSLDGADVIFWVYAGATAPPPALPSTSVWSRYRFVSHLESATAPADATHIHEPGRCVRDGNTTPTDCSDNQVPSSVAGGPFGASLSFSSSTGHLHFGGDGTDLDVQNGVARTYSLWFRVEPDASGLQTLLFRDNNCRGVQLHHNDTVVRASHSMGSCADQNYQHVEVPASKGRWVHVSFTVDRRGDQRSFRLRVYGPDVSSGDVNYNDTNEDAGAGYLRLGADWNSGNRLNGQLDEVRVFDGAEELAWSDLQHRSMTDTLIDYGSWGGRP